MANSSREIPSAQSGTGVRESFSGEAGNVSKGPECRAKAAAFLEKFKLPAALFPLSTIEEFGFNEASGLMWMKQPVRSEQEFPEAEIVVHYHRAIHGYVEAQRLKKVVGFKVKDVKEKDLFISVPYNEIKIDGDQVMILSENGEPRAFSASLLRTVAKPSTELKSIAVESAVARSSTMPSTAPRSSAMATEAKSVAVPGVVPGVSTVPGAETVPSTAPRSSTVPAVEATPATRASTVPSTEPRPSAEHRPSMVPTYPGS